jgi:transcriptional regulator with XRE-family HTH domain
VFPKRLKAARERAGLTQAELAQRLDVSRALPGHWETGRKTPSYEILTRIARVLDVSVSWLTGDTLGDGTAEYQRAEGPALILSDYDSPPGLRDLASNKALAAALEVTPEEWVALRSLAAPDGFTEAGYVAVLMALRAHV